VILYTIDDVILYTIDGTNLNGMMLYQRHDRNE
jgi:hypothetical protein